MPPTAAPATAPVDNVERDAEGGVALEVADVDDVDVDVVDVLDDDVEDDDEEVIRVEDELVVVLELDKGGFGLN